MTKRYDSKIREALTLKNAITIDDVQKVVAITFNRANMAGKKCYFITDNKEEQMAIEESREFKNGFISVSGDSETEEKTLEEGTEGSQEDPKKDFEQLEASKKQLAIEELTNKFPELAERLSGQLTNAQIEVIANEKKCTFPNLKLA